MDAFNEGISFSSTTYIPVTDPGYDIGVRPITNITYIDGVVSETRDEQSAVINVSLPIVTTNPYSADIPILNDVECSALFFNYDDSSYTNFYKYTIQTFTVAWFPVSNATYYQVFIIENGSTAFVLNTTSMAPLYDISFTGYSQTPFFTLQSDPLPPDQLSYTFEYPYPSTSHKINAFVFAYAGEIRSAFPTQMSSFVGDRYDRTAIINSRFIENTDYKIDSEFYNVRRGDPTPNNGGADQNTLTKPITQYLKAFLVVPDGVDYTANGYEAANFKFPSNNVVEFYVHFRALVYNDTGLLNTIYVEPSSSVKIPILNAYVEDQTCSIFTRDGEPFSSITIPNEISFSTRPLISLVFADPLSSFDRISLNVPLS
jgi:hypothetical protein